MSNTNETNKDLETKSITKYDIMDASFKAVKKEGSPLRDLVEKMPTMLLVIPIVASEIADALFDENEEEAHDEKGEE